MAPAKTDATPPSHDALSAEANARTAQMPPSPATRQPGLGPVAGAGGEGGVSGMAQAYYISLVVSPSDVSTTRAL